MLKGKRFLSIVVCFAMLLGALPFFMGATLSPGRQGYNENLGWSFTPPSQGTRPFASSIIPVNNADLSQTVGDGNFIFSSAVTGWEQRTNTATTIGGALNTRQFARFRTDQITNPGTLNYFNVAPTMGIQNDYVFVLGNNRFAASDSSASFTSEPIHFNADGYFIVSVDFYAVQGFGSFYLNAQDGGQLDYGYNPRIHLTQASFTCHQSGAPANDRSIWRRAQFFINTDAREDRSFSLGLYLGSKSMRSRGVIYFQNPNVTQVSREAFNDAWGTVPGHSGHFARRIELSSDQHSNPQFIRNTSPLNRYYSLQNKKITEEVGDFVVNRAPNRPAVPEDFGTIIRPAISVSQVPARLNFRDASHVHLYDGRSRQLRQGVCDNVMLLAANNNHASLRLAEPFTINRHQIYMISFYVFGSAGGNTSIRFRQHDREDKPHDEYFDSMHLTIETGGAPHKNGWALNTFFIRGESHLDIAMDIEFWIGTEQIPAFDFMLVDGFQIQRVSEEYYQKHAQGGDNDIFLDQNQATDNIANAFFNIGAPRSVTAPYPLRAQDWMLEYDEHATNFVISGIVNTQPLHWNRHAYAGAGQANNYGIALRPGSVHGRDLNNNVHMMQNAGRTWQRLLSSPIALDVGITNVISFDIMRQHFPNMGLDFWVTAELDGREIGRLDLSFNRTGAHGTSLVTTGWETHSIALRNSVVTSRSIQLVFNMGTATRLAPAGVVFLDNISMGQTTEAARNVKLIDLNDTRRFFESDNIDIGFLNDETLQLRNTRRTHAGTARNTLGETLTGGNFYEYRIRTRIVDGDAFPLCREEVIYTNNLRDFERNRCRVVDGQVIHSRECGVNEWGINFTLYGFEGGFHNISGRDLARMQGLDENGFVELIFFIRPDTESELLLEIAFGDEHTAITADVFIQSMSLRQMDEYEFLYMMEEFERDSSRFAHMAFITEAWTPEDERIRGPRPPFQWYIVIPSIIMALFIFVAIIGFIVRRFKFKWHVDKHHTTYANDDKTARMNASKDKKSKKK